MQIQQKEMLEQGFAEMKGAINRMGKKDWFNAAIGLLVNVVVAAAFAPDAAHAMFNAFTSAVAPIFHVVLNLLGPQTDSV
jgi:hypothetical protein